MDCRAVAPPPEHTPAGHANLTVAVIITQLKRQPLALQSADQKVKTLSRLSALTLTLLVTRPMNNDPFSH